MLCKTMFLLFALLCLTAHTATQQTTSSLELSSSDGSTGSDITDDITSTTEVLTTVSGSANDITTEEQTTTETTEDSATETTTGTDVTTATDTIESTTSAQRCPDNVDAVDEGPDGKTYAFKDSEVFRFTDNTLDDDFPKPISEVFPLSPDRVDAAVTVMTRVGKITLLFKENRLWAYRQNGEEFNLVSGPRSVQSQFGFSGNVDAAFTLGKSNEFYLKTGLLVRKIKIDRKGKLKTYKPQSLRKLKNLKNVRNFDAAYTSGDGETHIFDKDVTFTLDDRGRQSDPTRKTATALFGCDEPSRDLADVDPFDPDIFGDVDLFPDVLKSSEKNSSENKSKEKRRRSRRKKGSGESSGESRGSSRENNSKERKRPKRRRSRSAAGY